MEYPNLTRNPIADAIVEIKLGFSDEYSPEQFLSFYEKVKGQFPEKNELVQVSAKISEDSEPTIGRKSYGYVFSSKEKNKSIHTRHNAFSLSYLNKTYKNWDDFWQEFSTLFDIFQELYHAEIKGLSIRFINELQIPMKEGDKASDLSDYLKLLPNIPDIIENKLSGFFMQVSLTEENKTATITQTINPTKNSYLPFIFDLSAETKMNSREDFEKCSKEIREFKNKIFFGSITEKMRKLLN